MSRSAIREAAIRQLELEQEELLASHMCCKKGCELEDEKKDDDSRVIGM